MTIHLPTILAPSVAAAVRLFATELRHTAEESERLLAEPAACVADPDVERLRLANLKAEAAGLMLWAKLVTIKLPKDN